jgi:hypothetical protein
VTEDDYFAAILRRQQREKMERWLLIAAAAAIGLISTYAGWANLANDETNQRVGVLLWIAAATHPGLHDFIGIGFALLLNSLVIGAIAWAVLAAAMAAGHRLFRSSEAARSL